MPYRRRYTKKNTRPGYAACGKMVLGDAAKALRMIGTVKSLLNVEFKQFNFQVADSGINATGTVTPIMTITAGDDDSSRTGQQVKLTSIAWKGRIRLGGASTVDYVRLLIVKDKQPNNALFALGDLWHNHSVGTSNQPFLHRDINNTRRFSVLYDRLLAVDSAAHPQASFKMYKKLAIPLRYETDTGTISDFSETSISLVLISDTTADIPVITYNLRCRFIDN